MYKLNQKGFGMVALLTIICVFLLFVLIFSIIASNNGLEHNFIDIAKILHD